jgi:hypothetical protein
MSVSREELITGITKQALLVLEQNPVVTDWEVFYAMLETGAQQMNLISDLVKAYSAADQKGNDEDAAAYLQLLFQTCNAAAICAVSVVAHLPPLDDVVLPDTLREIWGLDEFAN